VRSVLVLPSARFDIAGFGELIADPSRVTMLLALMDGRARPASELARLAGIAPATASSHLKRLLEGRAVAVEPSGRHRYFRLASEAVADALETIALIHPLPARTAPIDPAREAIARARTCYKHLAGRLGVAWLDGLEKTGLIALSSGALALTGRGCTRFAALGFEADRYPAGKPCLDWTERKSHLGGPLGVFLTERLFALRWIVREKEGRAVRITTLGRRAFASEFNVAVD
jgi:DNA-binding transcriptional ArsR family regulator